jgi:peptidoglycan/LPS O-acetylase OafA/YrhL
MHQAEKPFLNTLRWTSAFLVMTGHAFGWVYDTDSPHLSIAKYILDLGHGAVVIFFVVSGYLVGGGVLKRAESFRLTPYAAARFSRIYIVVVPALALTALLDWGSWLILPDNPIYSQVWGRLTNPVYGSYTTSHIVASVLSLESIVGPAMGSNKPLWSLGFEWFFYFLFPMVLLSTSGFARSTGTKLLACVALVVPMLLLHQRWMILYWLIWLAGAWSSTAKSSAALGIAGTAVCIVSLLLSPFIDQRITDVFEGAGLALLLSWPRTTSLCLSRPLDKRLADMSYSLYLTHMPIFTFAIFGLWLSGLFPLGRFTSFVPGIALLVILNAVAAGVAYLFYRLFERRTDAFKAVLLRRYKPREKLVSAVSMQ